MKLIRRQVNHIKRIKETYQSIGVKINLPLYVLLKMYRTKKQTKRNDYYRKKAQDMGYLFTTNTPANLFNEILFDRPYEINGFKPKKGDTVIDIGAYYGDSAIWWAKKFKAKVIAFEPLPEAFNELVKNLKLNGVEDRVIAHNTALGSGTKITGGKGKGTMFTYFNQEQTLKTKRLDDFGIDNADIIKIDVEGFEYDVLKGAVNTIKKLHPKIILEVHSIALRKKCDFFLNELGYKLVVEGRAVNSNQKRFDKVVNLFYA